MLLRQQMGNKNNQKRPIWQQIKENKIFQINEKQQLNK
jgi:hypothetical protein